MLTKPDGNLAGPRETRERDFDAFAREERNATLAWPVSLTLLSALSLSLSLARWQMVSAIAPLPNTPRWVERDLRRGIKLVNPEYYAICECIFGTLYRYIYIRDCVSENRDKTYSFVSHYPRTVTFEGWSEVSLAKTRLLSMFRRTDENRFFVFPYIFPSD